MADKPISGNAGRPADVSDKDQRLGGPPGLFDSPNIDRETNGGIVQRVRAPASDKPQGFYPFDSYSLNDSYEGANGKSEGANIDSGTAFRRSIRGTDM